VDLENNGTCALITFYNRQTGTTPVTLPATTPEPASTESSSPCSEYYTVKRGDTLYGIARRFNMSWDEIEQVNDLANPRVIHVGNVLCIP
jgi:LysM repeat protein